MSPEKQENDSAQEAAQLEEQEVDDGPTPKLAPSSLRHHEDGSVTIEGEEVDDPDEESG